MIDIQVIKGYVNRYIDENGHKVWTGPYLSSSERADELLYFSAWMMVTTKSGDDVTRIEVMNHIRPVGYTPDFKLLPPDPVFLAFMQAPVSENFKTEFVLRRMFHDADWIPYFLNGYQNNLWYAHHWHKTHRQ